MPKLCVIQGDGIGKEVIPAAVQVLERVIPDLSIIEAKAGWNCYLETGSSVPEKTLSDISDCKAALFGAVSSPARKVEGYRSAIITMRKELDLFSNIRPVKSIPNLTIKPNVDLVIVRENTEGLYIGRERLIDDTAIAQRVITHKASFRIGKRAFDLAKTLEKKHLTIVHKANILPLTDGLFRDSVLEAIAQHSIIENEILVDELLVDVAAMRLASEPDFFDIIVTTNLFGDILSDISANWCGGLGLAPSINWGDNIAVAEPVHGSAPDIAGQNKANPIAAILSSALLARYLWKLPHAAQSIESAVNLAITEDLHIENFRFSDKNSTDRILSSIMDKLA